MARRIGDVARAAGVGVETIRFYERKGLVEQPPKPLRGWRDYGDEALLQVSHVRLAKQLGLTLGDMGQLKSLGRGERAVFCEGVRQTLSQRLARLDRDIRALQRKRTALRQWLGQCRQRGASEDCPLYAQLQPATARTAAKQVEPGKRR